MAIVNEGRLRVVPGLTVEVDLHATTWVDCGSCGVRRGWTARGRRFPGLFADPNQHQPSLADVIEAMEKRWEAIIKERTPKSPRLAVGLRFDVFMRDDFRCRYCGVSVDDGAILHADHVIPESKGGPTTLENLVTACIDCNLGKSDKDLPSSTVLAYTGVGAP